MGQSQLLDERHRGCYHYITRKNYGFAEAIDGTVSSRSNRVGGRAAMVDLSRKSNETLLAFWENIRRQVIADQAHGRGCRFAGERAGAYLKQLRRELDRRQLQYAPIQSEI